MFVELENRSSHIDMWTHTGALPWPFTFWPCGSAWWGPTMDCISTNCVGCSSHFLKAGR